MSVATPAPPPVDDQHLADYLSSEGGETTLASFARISLGDRHIGYGSFGGGSVAILNPLCYGVTLPGLRHTPGRRSFLSAMAAGSRLIAYDQQGAGSSAGRASADWDERASDTWAVADALNIERAVLYGVFDAGHTVLRAALQQPERVLGIILNSVPAGARPATETVLPEQAPGLDRWFRTTNANHLEATMHLLSDLGLDPEDASVLALAWDQTVSAEALQDLHTLMMDPSLGAPLPAITAPTLALVPHRALFHGWCATVVPSLPRGRAVETKHSLQALGSIHAFLAKIESEQGRDASALHPSLAVAANASKSELQRHARIIVIVEDDPSSGRAVELACRLGALQHAEIVITHVDVLPYAVGLAEPHAERDEAAQRSTTLGAAIARRHGLRVDVRRVTARKLSSAIVDVAGETRASLVVIGSRKAPEERDDDLSETVRDVIRRTSCEVLVDRG